MNLSSDTSLSSSRTSHPPRKGLLLFSFSLQVTQELGLSSPRFRSTECGMRRGEVFMRPDIWGEGSGIWALTPQQGGPQLRSGLPVQGRGGSSGPRHPLCGAGSSQNAVLAETLCSGPHSDPPSAPPTLLLGFLSHVASLLSDPYLPRDPSILAPFSPYFPRTQESASIAC